MRRILRTRTPAETEAIGEWLGERARPRDLIDLRGELGAGKTCLVRGLARGLGVEGLVRSPTFTIVNVHRGRVPLFHLDAYRLEDPIELLEQGWDDMLGSGVVAVEWGGRVAPLLPEDRLILEIGHRPDGRLIGLAPGGPRSSEWLDGLPSGVDSAGAADGPSGPPAGRE